jgi:uncharacterized protein YbjT (DUF2867 family)
MSVLGATWQRLGLRAGRRGAPKRVLVTGATGFIGRKLVYRLIERGDSVLVFARNAAKAADLFGPHADVVTDLAAVPATTRIDAIVNLAGARSATTERATATKRCMRNPHRAGVSRRSSAGAGRRPHCALLRWAARSRCCAPA